MSLKVLQALHTLLGSHIQQQKKGTLRSGRAMPGGMGVPNNPPVQGGQQQNLQPMPDPGTQAIQGGQYNPGFTPLQGSRRVRPIQGGRPWYQ